MKKPIPSATTTASEEPRPRSDAVWCLRAAYPAAIEFEMKLGPGSIEIGREQLEHSTVSRRHFSIRFDPRQNTYFLRDLGSRNGTRLNGHTLDSEERALELGSVLRAGDVLLVVDRAATPATAGLVSLDAIPGAASSTEQLRAAIARVSADAAPVVVIGETGTGKEKIAGEIHRLSGRKGPFIGVNCAGLNAQLIESQLFGHVRGAFTGADAPQEGLFRAAEGGTLLLDEIGDLPLELQPKLLRVIQEREVLPVGSHTSRAVDVRVIGATHRDLARAAVEGTFRRDLYARLSLWEVQVPALRDRRLDILDWFDRLSKRRHGKVIRLGANAAEVVLVSSWPSNLRGVDRLVHELDVVEGELVAREQLPAWLLESVGVGTSPPQEIVEPPAASEPAARAGPSPVPTREEFEKVFKELGGNVRATAKHFNRDRRQVYRWLKTYGLKES